MAINARKSGNCRGAGRIRRARQAAAVVTVVLLGLVLTATAAVRMPPESEAQAMLEAVNAERRERGARPLALDARLVKAAATHARDLQATGRFEHEGSDGSRVGDRVTRAGYRWSRVGENLARNPRREPAVSVARQWMRSAPHRANMLNRQFTHMGAARAGTVWVLVLGRQSVGGDTDS